MRALCTLLLLAGCTKAVDRAPDAPASAATVRCEAEAERDPALLLMRMKAAGSETFMLNHMEDMRLARADAMRNCLGGGSGLQGGVERPRR